MRVGVMTAVATLAAACLGVLALLVAVAGGGQGAAAPASGCVGAGSGADLSGEQLANAAAIVRAGAALAVPERGQVIALATALQESTLHNLPYGDRDSLGLFQQRATGWGPAAARLDPKQSATRFYLALLALPHWQDLPLTVAADRVQHSAFPAAYAKWETTADQVVAAFTGRRCPASTAAPVPPPDPSTQTVINRALGQLGQPYVWGGGGPGGPTGGGFDCSGLMVFAFAGAGVAVPHQTLQIWRSFQPAIRDPRATQPGDMLLFAAGPDPGTIEHVGLYLGQGRMVHAPETGETVSIATSLWTPGGYWATRFVGAVRGLSGRAHTPN